MRTMGTAGRRAAALAATAAMVAALGATTAHGQAEDMPPSRSIGPGERSPVTFVKTPLGKGLKEGRRIPRSALVKRQVLTGPAAAPESETSVNAVPPKGQNITSAVVQVRNRAGRVVRTWNGSIDGGPVMINSAIEGSAAGILVTLPKQLPRGATVVVWSLFRRGAGNNTG